MRKRVALIGAIAGLLAVGPGIAGAQPSPRALRALRNILRSDVGQAGGSSGADVVDLTTGRQLFSRAAGVPRLPASVEKLYTTSTALLRFGPAATLPTSVLGQGTLDSEGLWQGTLYLRGGGDPTFGSAGFDGYAYGTGATIQRLAANLIRASGIKSVRGAVVGDESYFDSLRGTPPYGFQFAPDVEGSLSALAYNRGLIDQGSAYVLHPALFAAQQLISALRADGVKVAAHIPTRAAATPAGAQLLATVNSPRMATLIQLTNTPSDNFFAEMLLKGIGARFGTGGTTASGAAVVRAELASRFGIRPQLNDGSGLSRMDLTTPRQVEALLAQMAGNHDFVNSLAIAGQTGTLAHEMNGTIAQGRCIGKTGTLSDVASLAGYCHALDGHTLAFAFLMNSLSDPAYGHAVQAGMAIALAKYNG